MKIRQETQQKYAWYLSCSRPDEPRPLEKIPMDLSGASAIEAFHLIESQGCQPPTREPLLLERFIKGKEWHGVTVKNVAEDFAIGRVAFSSEIKAGYPDWVAAEIFQQAKKIAMNKLGFIPGFVAKASDFTETPFPTSASALTGMRG